ncbi:hypothetical protein L873DRAFT_1819582 [Choiromyces venosus 120613-1]|uniref:Uncharacterized protein n=1 Tax=Choiromyces venosus 120613-1 TaxID=1336337 RepID=A0A3N4IZG3_9PEZI|nr:hypothetical protein L873DRAFT_1819582 [Choiromyces venosus 120613-1]
MKEKFFFDSSKVGQKSNRKVTQLIITYAFYTKNDIFCPLRIQQPVFQLSLDFLNSR